VKQDIVHGKFGQGRVFDAKTAVRLGMADRVATLAEVLGQASGKNSGSARAADEIIPPYAGPWAGEPGGICTGKIDCKCSGAAHIAVVVGPVESSAVRADDSECGCDCVPCDGGDCDNCDCDACDCEGCNCASAVAKLKAKNDAKAEEELKVRARGFDRMRHELSQAAAR
jgi:hypothetical protein